MDVSKNSISVAVLPPDRDVAEIDKISPDAESVRRLIKRIGRPSGIWACYEAGPTGYDLYRQLSSMKVRCDVVAPSLVPKGRGDRVKTDKRDARRLAGLHRAGELTPIAVPNREQEAVRDLCRTRGDMVQDLTRARNRLTKFLLRHSMIYRGGSNWTFRHDRWLSGLVFDDKALEATFRHYRATVQLREAALEAVEADLAGYFTSGPFADAVTRLGAYRGITHMGALCLGAEVFDWRRFPNARSFMSFTGLTCSENSTGLSERRGASPAPATATSAASSAKPPGPTNTAPHSAPPSAAAKTASAPTPSPGPGKPRSASPSASPPWPPARTSSPSSPPPSPASSPTSSGQR